MISEPRRQILESPCTTVCACIGGQQGDDSSPRARYLSLPLDERSPQVRPLAVNDHGEGHFVDAHLRVAPNQIPDPDVIRFGGLLQVVNDRQATVGVGVARHKADPIYVCEVLSDFRDQRRLRQRLAMAG